MRHLRAALAAILFFALVPLLGVAPAAAQYREFTLRPTETGFERVPLPHMKRSVGAKSFQHPGGDYIPWTDNKGPTTSVFMLGPSMDKSAGIIDLYPKGTITTQGRSWSDYCDRDLTVANTALACTRVMHNTAGARFGLIYSDPALERPVEIVLNSTRLAIFRRNASTLVPELIVGPWNSTDAFAEMRALRQQITTMTRRLAAFEAKVRAMERAAPK